eukprot:scaffold4365_cov137-Ochromonas_danica.AAC.4
MDGYGGADCSVTAAELFAEQALRSQLLDGLSTVVSKSDSDTSSKANAATSIARDQHGASVSSSSQVANLAQLRLQLTCYCSTVHHNENEQHQRTYLICDVLWMSVVLASQ